MEFDNNSSLRTAIEEYVKDVLEVEPEDVEASDDDELWGYVLDWISWLTGRLASQECKIERLESVIFEDEDDDDLDEDEDDTDTELEQDEYDDLDCEADE